MLHWIKLESGARSKREKQPGLKVKKIETYAMIKKQIKKDIITCFKKKFHVVISILFFISMHIFAPFNNMQIFASKHNICDKIDIKKFVILNIYIQIDKQLTENTSH